MTQTVRGIFFTPEDAKHAIADLIERGFPRETISLIGPGSAEAGHITINDHQVEHVEDLAIGAVGGGLIGGALGALVGMIVVGIPGIGPVLLAGPLVAALGGSGVTMAMGAGAGAVSGGILGALEWAGIADHDSHVYEEFIRRGATLVMVQASGHERAIAAEILHRDGAAEAPVLADEWRHEGLA